MTHKCRRCKRTFRTTTELQRHHAKDHASANNGANKLPWIFGAVLLLAGGVGAGAILPRDGG